MGSTSATNAIFTGSSQFSTDFNSAIQRAVGWASLPMHQMQNDLNTLTSQQSEMNTLNTDFGNLQSAIRQIQTAGGVSSLTASSTNATATDPTVASVVLGGAANPGTFLLDVTSPGVYSTSMSFGTGLTTVSDPTKGNISDATTYSLTVGTAQYTITPSGNTLQDLTDALNQSGEVQAVLVNMGSPAAPNYRLSVQGKELADSPILLTALDGSNQGQALLDPQTTGEPATYQLNGQDPINSNTSTVTISPGITLNLLAAGEATVAVSRSTSALSNAFSNLTSAYNTATAEVNKNHGQNAQALAGQSIIIQLSAVLHSLTSYTTGNSGISSLTALGFSFNSSGVLSFDPSAFASATAGQTQQLTSFLGSATSGGFLRAATDTLASLEDPTNGVLTGSLSSLASQITAKNQDISDQQTKITQIQTNLQTQMAKADAAIASMEQEFLNLQTLFTDMQNIQKNS